MTISLGLEALSKPEIVAEKVAQIIFQRRQLEIRLPQLSCVQKVFFSDANFLLVYVKDADGLYQYLAENGIIARNRSKELHCENCLRITVGTEDENRRLLEVMSGYP